MPVDISLARIDMASARTEEEAFQKIHKHIKVVVEESVDQFTFILDEEMDLGKRIMIITELVKVLQLDIYINDLFPALVAQIDEKLARLARGEKIESPERDAWDRKNLPRHKEVFPELLAKTKDLKQELENTVKRLERNVELAKASKGGKKVPPQPVGSMGKEVTLEDYREWTRVFTKLTMPVE